MEVKVCATVVGWGSQVRVTPQEGVFEHGFGGCIGVFGGALGEALTGSSVMVPLGPAHCSLGP